MSTAKEILGKISDYAGRPASDKFLSFAVTKLFGRIAFYLQMLENSSNQNWLVGETILNASPNQETYLITAQAGDFGRPILVETYDPSNPNHIVREIEIVQLQDRDKYYQGRKLAQVGTSTYSKHTAACITFTGFQEIEAMVTPTPMNAAQYRIYYEPRTDSETALDQQLRMIPNFTDLVAVHVALISLSDAQWPDLVMEDKAMQEQAHQRRREEKRRELEPEFNRLLAVFNDYRLNNKYESASQRLPFNSYRRLGGVRTRWGF